MKVVRESDFAAKALAGRIAVVLFGRDSGSEVLTHTIAFFDVGHAPGHTHVNDEVFFVDSGEGEVLLDGVPHTIGPGTLVHTPGDMEHSVHTTSDGPVRLVAFTSPHMVPGSYEDLPPRTPDRREALAGDSPLVIHERDDPVTGRGLGVSITTDRLAVATRWIDAGDAVEIAANGRDAVINVLDGTGDIRQDGVSSPVARGSAILLTGEDCPILHATTDLRIIEGRAIGTGAPP
ncbi:MAG TPA: cupin domain-containing protein [Candidatus Limnocylindrales bacterium]|nr:cupin domain-containing protein [Candidatus Limnocylindrales bacterium]